METLTIPIYMSKELPSEVTPHDLHLDFELSTPYIIENTDWYDKTDIRYYQEKYPTNSIIIHEELIQLCDFWNLAICEPEAYLGGFPYENQLEVKDFYERFSKGENIKIKDMHKPIIISTKDLVDNEKELFFKKHELEREITHKKLEINMLERLETFRRDRRNILKQDPLVLYPVHLNLNSYVENMGYIVASAWGFEKELLK